MGKPKFIHQGGDRVVSLNERPNCYLQYRPDVHDCKRQDRECCRKCKELSQHFSVLTLKIQKRADKRRC